jgi:hypothetical protein
MRIKATVGANSIYINFEIYWADVCFFLTPVLDPYPNFFEYARVLYGPTQIIANKNLVYAEPAHANRNCGPIVW